MIVQYASAAAALGYEGAHVTRRLFKINLLFQIFRVFSKELDRCRNNVDELGPVFERNERKILSMYTKYSHNKPKSEQLAEEFAGYLGVSWNSVSDPKGYSNILKMTALNTQFDDTKDNDFYINTTRNVGTR